MAEKGGEDCSKYRDSKLVLTYITQSRPEKCLPGMSFRQIVRAGINLVYCK